MCFLAVLAGILLSLGIIYSLGRLPLSFDHPLYKRLGIEKRQVIGFQPYFLLDRADKDYEKYLTDLTYFGLTIDIDGRLVKLNNPQEEEPGWTTLRLDKFQSRLKQVQKKGLQASILVFNANEASISALLKEPQQHAVNLVDEVAPIMKEHGFGDLNLDIESFRPASESAQQAYTDFVKKVKNKLEEKKLGTLTVEVTAISLLEPRLTDVRALGEIADRLVLMAYDYNYLLSHVSGPVAPLGGAPQQREMDVRTSLQELVRLVPPEKVILGIPLYGYQWETLSGNPGSATIPGGGSTASHRRVQELIKTDENCQKDFDEDSQQPYVICQRENYYEQIFYEDEQSIEEKIKLAQEFKIAGVALWALGYEGEQILGPIRQYKESINFEPALAIFN